MSNLGPDLTAVASGALASNLFFTGPNALAYLYVAVLVAGIAMIVARWARKGPTP